MFAKRIKNLGLCLSILLAIVFICFSSKSVLAGTDDIVRKQKEKERQAVKEKNESQRKEKAVYDRSLELFDIVVSVLEELHKKGMKFEKIGDIKVIKGREMYVRYYSDSVGYDPIVATKFHNEVIMHGSFLLSEEIQDPYTIRFEPQHGRQIRIEISTRGDDDKHFYVEIGWKPEVVIPLYESNSLKNKKNEIREKLLERIEAVLK